MADLYGVFRLMVPPCSERPWGEIKYEGRDFKYFINFAHDYNNVLHLNQNKQPILFRGQANSDWTLKPKLYRLLEGCKEDEALRIEFDSINYFKQQSRLFLDSRLIPKDSQMVEWLGWMQHYSAPTRMLDWTTSFNIALYFATLADVDKPGAVWCLLVHPLRQ